VFYLLLHLDSIAADNSKTSTHHFVVRVDDRRSWSSVGEHSEKGGDSYVGYHLHDGAHLSSFLKKITNTICNTHERSMFSTIARKFHASSTTINRTVSKSNFPSGLHTVIDDSSNPLGIFVEHSYEDKKFHRRFQENLLVARIVEQIEIPLAGLFEISVKYNRIEDSTK